jgi:hypothetical protein
LYSIPLAKLSAAVDIVKSRTHRPVGEPNPHHARNKTTTTSGGIGRTIGFRPGTAAPLQLFEDVEFCRGVVFNSTIPVYHFSATDERMAWVRRLFF